MSQVIGMNMSFRTKVIVFDGPPVEVRGELERSITGDQLIEHLSLAVVHSDEMATFLCINFVSNIFYDFALEVLPCLR